jgi:hypothetical protein
MTGVIVSTGSSVEVTSPLLTATDIIYDAPSPTLTVSCTWSDQGTTHTWTSNYLSSSPATTTFTTFFPYGFTVVVCTARDGGDNVSPPAWFRVVVTCHQGYSYDAVNGQCKGADEGDGGDSLPDTARALSTSQPRSHARDPLQAPPQTDSSEWLPLPSPLHADLVPQTTTNAPLAAAPRATPTRIATTTLRAATPAHARQGTLPRARPASVSRVQSLLF